MPAIIIPAHLQSSRLPRKLLLNDTGFPLLWHTIQRALESKLASIVVVATEDEEIARVVDRFKIEKVHCILTPQCQSGTERVAWVVENHKKFSDHYDYVVNFQGDEPELPGIHVDSLIRELQNDNILDVTTLSSSSLIPHNKDGQYKYVLPSVVKVVIDHFGNAMYFSRASIPYGLEENENCLTHFGIYAYRREFLLAFRSLPNTTLSSEKLEQLQWLQSGFKIRVLLRNLDCVGIDTREEYVQFVNRFNENNK